MGIRPAGQSSGRAWAHVPRPRVRDGTVTSHPRLSKAHGAGERLKIRRTEAAILTTKSDEGQARDQSVAGTGCAPCARAGRLAKSLTAAVTRRRRYRRRVRAIRSSRGVKPWARRFLVCGRESAGGCSHGISRRALRRCAGRHEPSRADGFVQSRESTGLRPRVGHERRRPPPVPARPERRDVPGAVDLTNR